MLPALRTLVEAAILAPSGDNLQPWTFDVVDRERTITIGVDPARDQSPMNTGQRMARLAVGAALENMVQTCDFNVWSFELIPAGDAAVSLRLHTDTENTGTIPPAIIQRCTNRRVYQPSSLAPEQQAALLNFCPAHPEIEYRWILARPEIERMAEIIGAADAVMFSRREIRQAFAENVLFHAPRHEVPTEKLSVASLEISRWESLAMENVARLPDQLLRYTGLLRPFRVHARKLVRSATGILFIINNARTPYLDVTAGRELQATWMELNRRGFDTQPMMSFAVLDNLTSEHAFADDRFAKEASQALQDAASLLFLQTTQHIAAVLRFGTAQPPSGRVGRRPASFASIH